MQETDFDPQAKEDQLRTDSESWKTDAPIEAEPGDIPIIDISSYLATGGDDALRDAADQLRVACETVGFWQLVGHGISPELIANTFRAVTAFHALPDETKLKIRMDRPEWPLGGVGYLPVGERKLPRRAKGNLNEAFLMKSDRGIDTEDNQWLSEEDAPGFKGDALNYAEAVEQLALRLLPIYATALGVDKDHFGPGFTHPFWRLRMTHYPTDPDRPADSDEFGIAPHVDTTFFTLLLQDSPGLTIYSTPRDRWIKAPVVKDAFVVNSGELLKQWTNDRFLSVRHFANVRGDRDRYSIPFFFNANADYPMHCIPTCCSPDNPEQYPPISYNESQAVAQGE